MNDRSRRAEPKDPLVEAALREYLERIDRGEAVNPEAYIAEHAEIAEELRSLLAAEEQLRKLAGAEPAGESAGRCTQSFALHGQETVAPQAGAKRSAETGGDGLKGEFGRYRIVKALGKGAMGKVYLADDTQLQRQVALKTPHFDQEPTEELLERFYREARAAATLRHPNICPVHDVGQIDDTHYISMAYIEGNPLSAFIRSSKPQPERQILLVVRKLAQALEEAHDHGIVHRDLKPANIMVDKRNEPVIMDFGLARQLQRDKNIRLTQSGMLIGTPAYMSPEQIEGEPDKVGPASDQYSLGVILYELLTGQLPFRGSLTAVMAQIITKEAPRPSQVRPDLDLRIEAACLKMMAKDPAHRFASLKAVADELAAVLRNPGGKVAIAPAAGGATPSDSGVSASGIRQSAEKKSIGVPGQSASLAAKDVVSLEELARKCLSRRDYDQVIQIIERIPEAKRTAGLTSILEKALAKADEIAFLIVEIDEALRFNDRAAALQKTDELLAIKPGHHRGLKVQEQFAGYGTGNAARIGPLRQFTQPWSEGGWIPWSVLAFGLAVFGAMTAVLVIYLGGTAIVVDIQDPDVAVTVKGTDVVVAGPKREKVTVTPGDQELAIAYAGLKMFTKSFTLKKGEKRTVTVSVVDKQILAKLDNEALSLTRSPDEKATNKGPAAGSPAAGEKVAMAGAANRSGKNAAAAPVVQPPLLAAPFDQRQATLARQAWAQAQQTPEETKNSLGIDLVLIPAGQFAMGSPETADELLKVFPKDAKREWMDGERPVHRVTIGRPFYLGKYETTMGQFRKFVEETGYKTEFETGWRGGTGLTAKGEYKRQKNFNWREWGAVQTEDCPVANVTHKDAAEFCKWLSNKEGRQYRLPTEAEWEYACRAGSTTRFYNGDDPNALAKIANFENVSPKDRMYTWPVGRFAPNNFGLYDMSGNVSEWCSDFWSVDYYARSPVTDPEGPEHGKDHVSRGGGSSKSAIFCRSAHRRHYASGSGNNNTGFRVACSTASGLGTAPSNEPAPAKTAPLTTESSTSTPSFSKSAAAAQKPDDTNALVAPFDESRAKTAQQEWADRLKTTIERTNSIGMKLILIPPGAFVMGSPKEEQGRGQNEDLVRVTLTKVFWLGQHEVTQTEWRRVMHTTPWVGMINSKQGNDYPATYVNWADAVEFCTKLTEIDRRAGLLRPGSQYVLPTEAQWEYACRAGTTTRYAFGDDEEDLPTHAWFRKNAIDVGQKYPHRVGRKKSNAWGLFDMHGNVWEWCRDAYQEKLPGGTDPEVSSASSVRVNRSGCWGNPGGSCRSASRYGRPMSESRRDSLGFRIACSSSE